MSKARPHAHIYEKWVRGIKQAVPDEQERCGLYEYIIAYQFAKVYGAGDTPSRTALSAAAQTACAMLEGDLDELCDARRENNSKRAQNGAQNVPNSTEQVQAGANRTIQSNTIQNNTIQSQSNTTQALTDLLEHRALDEFGLGIALLRKGYIVRATQLHAIFGRANDKQAVLKNADKWGFIKCQANDAGEPCAKFVEATRCRDTRALEIYGVKVDEGVLCVRCTASAEAAIGTAGMDNAQAYAAQLGATGIQFFSSNE